MWLLVRRCLLYYSRRKSCVGVVRVQNKIVRIIAAVALFAAGYWLRGYLHTCPTVEPEIITKIEYRDRVQTEIAYVPKETVIYKDGSSAVEKTDIDMQLGKPELNVKVNGQELTIEKAEDEKYIFDKNKLTVTQQSSADLNIKLPTIDKTRRWGVGIGAASRKPIYFVKAPLKGNVGVWAAANKDDVLGGIVFEF